MLIFSHICLLYLPSLGLLHSTHPKMLWPGTICPNAAGLGTFPTLWAYVWEQHVWRWTSAHAVLLSEAKICRRTLDFCGSEQEPSASARRRCGLLVLKSRSQGIAFFT